MDGADRAEHFGVHHLLRACSRARGFERPVDILIAVVAGQRDDARFGKFVADGCVACTPSMSGMRRSISVTSG